MPSGKVVIAAHIDAYEDSPGALDNASGIVVLLLCAEMLSNYRGENCVEIAAFNGEDHYSAGGQMDYLKRYGGEFPGILLAVNIDDAGYKQGRSSYSFYECPPQLEKKAEDVFRRSCSRRAVVQWGSYDLCAEPGSVRGLHVRMHARTDEDCDSYILRYT